MPMTFRFGAILILIQTAFLATECYTIGEMPAEQNPEQAAIKSLQRITTNIQFNKDGTVRLLRLSKSFVTHNETLVHVKAFTKLDYLAIVSPNVTDEGLGHIADLTNLDTLMLSESHITGIGLAHLRRLSKLERLYLHNTPLNDDGFANLPPLAKLRILHLGNTSITGKSLKVLAGVPMLDALRLTNTSVSDAAIEYIAPLKKLAHLSLSGTKVTDACIETLCSLTELKYLELFDSNITKEGVAQLQTALPAATILTSINLGETNLVEDNRVGKKPAAPKQPPPGESTTADEVAPPIHTLLGVDETAPDFQRHVIPLLGRLGCNGRACHGSFQGQGGFRLSMFGYDFAPDHQNLSARVDIDSPTDSLILNKPTSADDHEGGLRLKRDSWEFKLLQSWIAHGAKRESNATAKPTVKLLKLDVTPAAIAFAAAKQIRQLKVVAIWSDGTREDVTQLARFQTNDDTVATVSDSGQITSQGKGDTYIISFYDSGVFSTQVLVPHTDKTGERFPQTPARTKIDKLVIKKLASLGIVPSPVADDADFLRRVGLDIAGTLPTPSQIADFVADTAADKRARKIDELLDHPAYDTWWTLRLCDLTGSNAGFLGSTEMAQPTATQWQTWLRHRVENNVGWDKIAAGIILATSRQQGERYQDFAASHSQFTRAKLPADYGANEYMPHFWYRDNITQPAEKALAFGYIFMGVRLQCAQCHKHPFDQWSKLDFEQFSEFFTRVKRGSPPDANSVREQMREMLGVPDKLNTAALRRQSYLRIAAEGRPIPWKEVYIEPTGNKAKPARLLGGEELDLNQFQDPREPLMHWLLNEPNRYFAKAFVNRIWANYFNVGIIEPPDDLNLANPPSNKELLNYLVAEFIESGYDMKWLHRTIANSDTYQRSWRTNDSNRTDERNFSRAVIRRLPAEVAIDAITQATANDKTAMRLATVGDGRTIGDHPRSYQARGVDYSSLIFGKPLRTTNCDCERQDEPTLIQALYIRNDQELLDWLDRQDGWLKQIELSKEEIDERDLIRSAYLRTVSRNPSDTELEESAKHIKESESTIDGLRDLMWALLNTKEFITNH
ncbi:MAG: hypothetical protein ACI9G1_000966 [Pirellulaceae bacterium]|jgi:hypothetical protein